jgi:hypothetical protein
MALHLHATIARMPEIPSMATLRARHWNFQLQARGMRLRTKLALTILPLLIAVHGQTATADEVNARYPYRLPDWVWQKPEFAYLLTASDLLALQADCVKLKSMQALEDSQDADAVELDIARRLGSKFTRRDLSAGAYVTFDKVSATSLAVQFDPRFDEKTVATLKQAATLFLGVALDHSVIEKAYARSTSTPSPMPEMYEMKDGKPVIDEAGRQKFSKDYKFFLSQRSKPSSIDAFTKHLRDALSPASGDPAVLLISQYAGNVWWGGAYYSYHLEPAQQLARESPPRGYFYIRLNTDKLTKGEPNWDDPAFWASKLAHEMLHTLAYWHPAYKDPAERDANNHHDQWAFIVSYELAVLDKLKSP